MKSERKKEVIIGTYDPALTSVVDGVRVRRVSSNAAAVKVIAMPEDVETLAESLDDLLPRFTDKSPFMTYFGLKWAVN